MVIPLIIQLDLDVQKNKKSIVATVKEVGGMWDLNIFILVSLVVGMSLGFHMIYRPVYLTELEGSKTMIGKYAPWFDDGYSRNINLPDGQMIMLYFFRSVFRFIAQCQWYWGYDSFECHQVDRRQSGGTKHGHHNLNVVLCKICSLLLFRVSYHWSINCIPRLTNDSTLTETLTLW